MDERSGLLLEVKHCSDSGDELLVEREKHGKHGHCIPDTSSFANVTKVKVTSSDVGNAHDMEAAVDGHGEKQLAAMIKSDLDRAENMDKPMKISKLNIHQARDDYDCQTETSEFEDATDNRVSDSSSVTTTKRSDENDTRRVEDENNRMMGSNNADYHMQKTDDADNRQLNDDGNRTNNSKSQKEEWYMHWASGDDTSKTSRTPPSERKNSNLQTESKYPSVEDGVSVSSPKYDGQYSGVKSQSVYGNLSRYLRELNCPSEISMHNDKNSCSETLDETRRTYTDCNFPDEDVGIARQASESPAEDSYFSQGLGIRRMTTGDRPRYQYQPRLPADTDSDMATVIEMMMPLEEPICYQYIRNSENATVQYINNSPFRTEFPDIIKKNLVINEQPENPVVRCNNAARWECSPTNRCTKKFGTVADGQDKRIITEQVQTDACSVKVAKRNTRGKRTSDAMDNSYHQGELIPNKEMNCAQRSSVLRVEPHLRSRSLRKRTLVKHHSASAEKKMPDTSQFLHMCLRTALKAFIAVFNNTI